MQGVCVAVLSGCEGTKNSSFAEENGLRKAKNGGICHFGLPEK